MSPSPEPVAPSPEQLAAFEILRICGREATTQHRQDAIVALLTAWRTRLYLAAKIEGKEEDARLVCDLCHKGWPTFEHQSRRFLTGEGINVPMTAHVVPDRLRSSCGDDTECDASAIHDTLAKLREEAK